MEYFLNVFDGTAIPKELRAQLISLTRISLGKLIILKLAILCNLREPKITQGLNPESHYFTRYSHVLFLRDQYY